MGVAPAHAIGVFRAEHAQVFASLWRRLGEFDLVDAALTDAYLAATAAWPAAGVPQNPATWIATVAMSATTSVLSRRSTEASDQGSPADDVRALLFGCCHPRLKAEEQVVCLARAVAGLIPSEIAALLGVPEATVTSRLNAAKSTLRKPGVGMTAPEPDQWAARVAGVHAAAAALRAAPGAEAAKVSALVGERIAQSFPA